jgi:hypothetical protein
MLHALLPTPGNVLFTLLVAAVLFWVQTGGAFPGNATSPSSSTDTIAYQGRLADAAGNPLTGTYNMTFKLYDVAMSGSALWTETWSGGNAVQVSDGLFNVLLGSITSISQSVIEDNATLWLGIKVGTDTEMIPRVQLGAVPYAIDTFAIEQDEVISNVEFIQGDTEQSVDATGYVDLVTLPITVEKASTFRVHFHSLVWKTVGGGRIALGIRINGNPNTAPDPPSLVQVGSPVTSNWSSDSLSLSSTYFVDVPAGTHSVTLVLCSWDSGTSHGRAYAMSVETLQQP